MSNQTTIALAGNPNSGKTTMFNRLTGARARVGNYPGVTVERREGHLTVAGQEVHVVDLPGTYSLTAYSDEELVARRFVVEERPAAVVQVIDSTTLDRGLVLAVQFLELGVPLVLALNMMDEVKKLGRSIDTGRLAELLGLPVVETVAREGKGTDDLVHEALALAAAKGPRRPLILSYGTDIDRILVEMTARILAERFLSKYPARWVALKYIEGDEEVKARGRAAGPLSAELETMAQKLDAHCLATLGVNADALVSDARWGYVAGLVRQGVVREDGIHQRRVVSERLDAVLTQRLVGPLVMLAILYGLFEIVFALGETPAGWLEGLFGWASGAVEAAMPDGLLRSLIVSGLIDGVGGVLGFTPYILIMFFGIAVLEDSGYMARMAYMLDRVFRSFGLHGNSVMPFIVSGGIAGGCAVPGVMATRTLRGKKEKIATLITAPFMSCGAKLPVYLLLVAAFFSAWQAQTLFAITLAAWAMALIVAKLLRGTIIKGEATPFVMELPPYRLPTLRGVLIHGLERTWQYIKKAGTVILAISVLLWAALTFPGLPEDQAAEFEAQRATVSAQAEAGQLGEAASEEAMGLIDHAEAQAGLKYSAAGRLGLFIEPAAKLAGFDWRTSIALIGGVAAKEVIVSTLGTAYSLGEVDPEESEGLSELLATDAAWSPMVAVSLIIFIMLYAPCFVTVVAIARESSWGWAGFSLVFNTTLAYALAVAVYQIGSLMS